MGNDDAGSDAGETPTDEEGGSGDSSGSGTDTDESGSSTTVSSPQDRYINNPPKVDQIDWAIEEGMVDGTTELSFNYTNNTEYTLYDVELKLVLKDDVTDEELAVLAPLKEDAALGIDSDEDLKSVYVVGHNYRVAEQGETVGESHCVINDIVEGELTQEQYALFVPDSMTMAYSAGDDNMLYKTQYSYKDGSYTKLITAPLVTLPTGPLVEYIPELNFPRVLIVSDTDTDLGLHCLGVTREDYTAFKQACVDKGFTNEAVDMGDSYMASSEDGKYDLSIGYRSVLETLIISVMAN